MEVLQTGIPGLDQVLGGGLPKGYTVLVGGAPGAGKTVLSSQVAFHHARQGRRVLMLSVLAESATKLTVHLGRFRFFDRELVGDQIHIVELQRLLTTEGLEATLGLVRSMVFESKAELLILDSLRGLHALAADGEAVQRFVHGLSVSMFVVGCTTVLLDDRNTPGSEVSAEHTLADAVIALEVGMKGRRELRRLRPVKVRGARPLTGKHTYTISDEGVIVYPRIESLPVEMLAPPISSGRLGWGVPGLDSLTDGGVPAYSSTLMFGTTGAGKTTMALQFVAAGIAAGERCVYLTFHETQEQLLHKAAGFGMELREAVESGALVFVRVPAAETDVDDVLHALITNVEDRGVTRAVLDTLNPLERDAAYEDRFTNILAILTAVLRDRRATTLMLREMTQLITQDLDLSEGREAYWTPLDNLVLLRPVEMDGALNTVLSVLKMRSSDHDKRFYRYTIGKRGVEVGEAVQGLQGVLMGLPRRDA